MKESCWSLVAGFISLVGKAGYDIGIDIVRHVLSKY